ncbi:MAG: hypothetical protein U9N34_10605, partial [Candidatus Cloacimonadota bacterium]|nr:hypothetical protein [Candidatus Cloacimonadota bacterium]
VKISILVRKKDQDQIWCYGNTNNILLENQLIPEEQIKSLTELGNVTIKWYKIEEANGNYYSNTYPSWHWHEIPYKETEVVEWRNKFIVTANVTPTVFDPVYCDDKVVGTMRYKAVLTIDGETYSTPGKDSKYKGSISNKVHRISLKGNTDNEVINYAFAMCNLPYIWGSASFTGDKYDNHQAELFIGADCADFCVAAHQMSGNQIPYDQVKNNQYTKVITTIRSKIGEVYLNSNRKSIKVGENGVKTGDFIYWNFDISGSGHVGLFYRDKSDPNGKNEGNADGIFNTWDLVIHTLFHEPGVKTIGDAYQGKIRIYRYKDKN